MDASGIERLSPETLAFLEYRNSRDQELAWKMHAGRPALTGDGPGAWNARLFDYLAHDQLYNATWDRDLWSESTGLVISPASVLKKLPPTFAELLDAMRAAGFLPIFEGKHIDQYVVGVAPIRWWLSIDLAQKKYGKRPRVESTVVFRETASNTNERTCIAAVLPPGAAGSNKLTGLRCAGVDANIASTVLNSICFDWALRLRSAGTNVSFTYMRPMPVPPVDVVNRLPRIPTRLAWETGLKHITDDRSTWPLLWEANRAVAEAYGLGPDDFEHILGSFPVMARKRPEFFAFLKGRLAEWKAEKNILIA